MTQPDHRINELVNAALPLYAALALNPEADYFDRALVEELNASRELDPSGLTTFMLLRGAVDNFLDSKSFSARTVLTDFARFRAETARIHELLQTVEDPAVVALIEDFARQIREMAAGYRFRDRKALRELIGDKDGLAVIRRNALRSMQTLQPHQFLQGKGSPDPLKVHGEVYEFWNVNSILAALRAQRYPGVALCLVRDPAEVMASYFCFAVSNGDNITILTDREEGPHPLYYQMSRRKGRTLAERAERHHFPYELLDLEVELGSGGNVKDLHARQREQLVPINTEAVPLKKLGELEPDQFVWAGLVLTLLAEKYGGVAPEQLPEISYTGEMVARPEALVSGESSLVLAGRYNLLQLPELKGADVTAETTAPQWERESTGIKEWMIERYGAEVPDAVLNPVGERQARQLVGEHARGLTVREDRGWLGHEDKKVKFEALSATTFGSPEKLQRDRVWAARVNQCRYVQALAEKEYRKERHGVIAWLRERAEARRDFILDGAAGGNLALPDVPFGGLPRMMSGEQYAKQQVTRYVGTYFSEGIFSNDRRDWMPTLGRWDGNLRPNWRCADTGAGATLFVIVKPTCPESLAALFGCGIEDLPVWLRHYHTEEPYDGNSILDRLDPADWQLDNPWLQLKIRVMACLSKSAVNARRRAQGLPAYGAADWEALVPESVKREREKRRGRY